MLFTPDQAAHLSSIRHAVAAYCHGLDRLDPAWMKAAYWPDAVDERWPVDIDTYVDNAMRVHTRFDWTMHCVQNHLVEFDPSGDTARGEIYVTAFLRTADPPTLHTFFGRYHDLYQQRDGDWRILRRACVHEGSQSVPHAPSPFPFDTMRQGRSDRPATDRALGP